MTPVVDEDGAPFWEYAARGELRIQACADCGELRFPPRVLPALPVLRRRVAADERTGPDLVVRRPGMACGGAFYLLGEAEFVIADESATFFDPHTTYGMVSAYESVSMAQRMPYGELARMALMGTAERVSARRAYEIGLVSELAPRGEALTAAVTCATVIASCPAAGVQGTVRALWTAREAARAHAVAQAPQLIRLGNLPPEEQAELFDERRKGFRLR